MRLRASLLSLLCSAATAPVQLVYAQEAAAPAAAAVPTVSGEFLVELKSDATLGGLYEGLAAKDVKYTTKHTFVNTKVFYGVSITLEAGVASEVKVSIGSVAGVKFVHDVQMWEVPEPDLPNAIGTPAPDATANSTINVLAGKRDADSFQPLVRQDTLPNGDLGFTLAMGGIDKLHAQGIKGKGIKIGFIDTAVDHTHPALGGGFGPGKKVVGGRSFISDDGQEIVTQDPGAACYEAHHGTHVAGIIGMDPSSRPGGWPVSGVAPEASLYPYRVFSCKGRGAPGRGGSTVMILQAMEAALNDGVDILSMSLSLGNGNMLPTENQPDPVAEAAQRLVDQGIVVLVAMGNPGSDSGVARSLYSQTQPSELATVIGVGSTANSNFPLVFEAVDSAGRRIPYGAIQPFFDESEAGQGVSGELDVYVLEDDACWQSSWDKAVLDVVEKGGDMNKTVFIYHVPQYNCGPGQISCCDRGETARYQPRYLLAAYDPVMTTPAQQDYQAPLSPTFGANTRLGTVGMEDAAALLENYVAAGGPGQLGSPSRYKLRFNSTRFTSPPQKEGYMPSYYSGWGPRWVSYELKPQLTAPGGNILSTYPTSWGGGYGIISGTSMATPYAAGCVALVKSQYPNLSPSEITALLQATARPQRWAHNTSIIAATPQQGAGLINPFDAIESLKSSRVWPGQILLGDNSRTEYGRSNFTLWNTSPDKTISYTFGHRGAGYADYQLQYRQMTQDGRQGSASFPKPTVELAPGASALVEFTIAPPQGVNPEVLPVFGGFVDIKPSWGPNMSLPYVGAPYHRYRADHLDYGPITSASQIPRPWFKATKSNGEEEYNRGLLAFPFDAAWSTSVHLRQWSRLWRVDVVPADTRLSPTWGPPNVTIPEGYVYRPPRVAPGAPKLFGRHESFGSVVVHRELASPIYIPSPSSSAGFKVKEGEDGKEVTLGPGDYRLVISVLRWGGDPAVEGDYETHLGGIMRLVAKCVKRREVGKK